VKAFHSVRTVFDDPNLVSAGGLVPVLRLAETAGLHDLLDGALSVDSPSALVKKGLCGRGDARRGGQHRRLGPGWFLASCRACTAERRPRWVGVLR